MSETNQNPDRAIRTPQELADAREAEAQLQRDITNAQAVGAASELFELRLQSVRAAIAGYPPAVPPSGSITTEPNHTNEPPPQTIRETISTQPLTYAPPPIQNPTSNPSIAKPPPAQPLDAVTAPSTQSNAPDAANTVPERGTANKPDAGADSSIAADARTPAAPWQIQPADDIGVAREESLGGLTPPTDAGGVSSDHRPPAQPDGGDSQALFDEISARALAAQSQSLQSGGDRLRAALEQNTAFTDSVFNRMLELLEIHNRRFSDLDRRIAEISGQMKSLKNP